MFEDVCFNCGKPLDDFARVYCSDLCEGADTTSPSISSASSALSSPHFEYAAGGDVPALVPSMLGSALNNCQATDRHSASSSSASSASWSIVSEDEDEHAIFGSHDEYDSDAHSTCENGAKPTLRVPNTLKPSALSYARRPSGTNNRRTVPLLHRRISSSSFSSGLGGPPSLSSGPTSEDDDDAQKLPEEPGDRAKEKAPSPAKPKADRNRASLPSYFSLLTMNSCPNSRMMPLSCAAGQIIAHHSPPTPTLCVSDLSESAGTPHPVVEATPRGRCREPGTSRSSRRSQQCDSQSRSRSRSRHVSYQPHMHIRARLDSKSSVEKVFDWSSAPLVRGRPQIRRNSSPPPKMLLPNAGLAEFGVASGLEFVNRQGWEDLDNNHDDSGSRRSSQRGRDREAVRHELH